MVRGFSTHNLCVQQHIKYLKLKTLKKTADSSHSNTYSNPSFLKQVFKFPYEKYSPCPRRKEDTLTTRNGELRSQKPAQISLVKLTLIFLGTSSPLTNPTQTPLSCQYFTNLLFLCLKGIKSSYSDHLFRSSFSCDSSHVPVKIR